jgi:hypothetical protein
VHEKITDYYPDEGKRRNDVNASTVAILSKSEKIEEANSRT